MATSKLSHDWSRMTWGDAAFFWCSDTYQLSLVVMDKWAMDVMSRTKPLIRPSAAWGTKDLLQNRHNPLRWFSTFSTWKSSEPPSTKVETNWHLQARNAEAYSKIAPPFNTRGPSSEYSASELALDHHTLLFLPRWSLVSFSSLAQGGISIE